MSFLKELVNTFIVTVNPCVGALTATDGPALNLTTLLFYVQTGFA